MRKVEPWKKFAFVFSLLAIAFIVSAVMTRLKFASNHDGSQRQQDAAITIQQEQQNAAEQKRNEEEEKAIREAKAEFEKYFQRYVNAGVAQRSGKKSIALLAVSAKGGYNQAVSSALARRFSNEGFEIYSTFFKPAFVSDGLFSAAFNGSTEFAEKLRLADSLNGFLFARQQVQYSTNAALENLITANVRLEVVTLSIATGQSEAWSFTANGPGFHTADALLMAEERLIKQISADTKMSLSSLSTNP